jgi:hypothetical protein
MKWQYTIWYEKLNGSACCDPYSLRLVDIFDHYEVAVSRPVSEHCGGKVMMGARA